jgi:hypothetical protein
VAALKAVGVPETIQFEVFKVRPAGSAEETVQLVNGPEL